MKKGFQVMEFGPTGGKHPVSKIYPTWLGARRVRNRIARENKNLRGYRWTIEEVSL